MSPSQTFSGLQGTPSPEIRLPPSGTWGQRSAEPQLRTFLRGCFSSKSPNRICWGFGRKYLLGQFPLPHCLICVSPEVTPHWTFFLQLSIRVRLPRSLRGKESACNARDMGSIPGSGRSSGGGLGNLLHYPCLENPMDRWAWMATVHGVTKSQILLSTQTAASAPSELNLRGTHFKIVSLIGYLESRAWGGLGWRWFIREVTWGIKNEGAGRLKRKEVS